MQISMVQFTNFEYSIYSLPSINVNPREWTFIEVLTTNNYKIILSSNIQILTFINNWMCSFYHPYYDCISFINIYRVKSTKKGVPFC